MNTWLEKNDIGMYSTLKLLNCEGKDFGAERLIKTLRKIHGFSFKKCLY